MANKYPYIGHSIDQTTMYNSNNQLVTPPSPSNLAHCSDKKSRVLSSLKATAFLCMLLLLFVLLPNIGWCQDCAYTTATIGSSTDNKRFEYSPVNNYYNYGYRQIIYDASELCGDGISCVIHKIAFHYAGSRTMSEKGDVRIYMAEVDRAAFTGNNNWEVFANFTEVYRGSLNCDGNSGWNWFTLNRSFNFSGNKHLIVAIWDNSDGYDAGGNNDNNRNRYGFYSTACTGNKMLYKDQDASAVNRNNPGNGTRTDRRPNTKFCVDCCSNSYSMSSTPLCFDFSDYAYPSAYGNVYSGLPACWSTIYNGQEVVDDDNDHVSGRGHIYSESARLIGMWAGYFDGYVQVNYGRYGYVILPSISGVTAGDVVSFDAFMTSNTNGTLTVGYMSDRNNANTFTVFYTAQNYTSQHSYECTIPAGWNNNSVLAFRWEYNSNTDAAGVFVDNICISHPTCTITPAFTNCPSSLRVGETWIPEYNTSATPTGWTTSNASYSAGIVTAGSTIGTATVSATVAQSSPYCAGTMTCEFDVTPDCTVLTMEDGLRQQLECGTTYCFYDDGGPNGDYISHSRRDTAIFTANGTITMTFNSLVAEGSDWDHLSVYDGTTPLIEAANSDPGYPLEATSGTMVVVWKTDGSVVKAGWDATITVTECCTPSTLTLSYGTTSASTTAGNSYTNTTLQGTGASNSNIVYTIEPTGQGAYIDENTGEVTSDQCTDGVFTVTATIPRTSSTCALSASYNLTVESENKIILNGNITPTIECGKSYCFFDSGGKNGTYSTYEEYTATFTSTGTGITINFESFVTESSSGCSNWDYIKIYDGDGTDESTLIVTRGQTDCTTNDLIPNQDYTTTTNTMTVKWKSDSSNNAAGWSATISATGCCNLNATIEFGD